MPAAAATLAGEPDRPHVFAARASQRRFMSAAISVTLFTARRCRRHVFFVISLLFAFCRLPPSAGAGLSFAPRLSILI